MLPTIKLDIPNEYWTALGGDTLHHADYNTRDGRLGVTIEIFGVRHHVKAIPVEDKPDVDGDGFEYIDQVGTDRISQIALNDLCEDTGVARLATVVIADIHYVLHIVPAHA